MKSLSEWLFLVHLTAYSIATVVTTELTHLRCVYFSKTSNVTLRLQEDLFMFLVLLRKDVFSDKAGVTGCSLRPIYSHWPVSMWPSADPQPLQHMLLVAFLHCCCSVCCCEWSAKLQYWTGCLARKLTSHTLMPPPCLWSQCFLGTWAAIWATSPERSSRGAGLMLSFHPSSNEADGWVGSVMSAAVLNSCTAVSIWRALRRRPLLACKQETVTRHKLKLLCFIALMKNNTTEVSCSKWSTEDEQRTQEQNKCRKNSLLFLKPLLSFTKRNIQHTL